MGLLYKGFQKLAYWSMEYYREEGIRVDKERQKELQRKHDKYIDDNLGVNWAYLNKTWKDGFDNLSND